jgi:ubiquinone/menaquinone biosynthesis C-methylase UbiE
MLLGGIIGTGLGFICWVVAHGSGHPWARFIVPPAFSMGVFFFVQAGVMLWGSKVGKLRLRDKILDAIPWRGDEHVLDVGCGHGLMLLGAAKRLSSGNAIGIDIWSQEDQKSNSSDATLENARREGVTERVKLINADAREMPFPDRTFDVVVSSYAIHNLYDPVQRARALGEINRVLKPGGHLAIADIRHVPEYQKALQELGWRDMQSAGPYFLFFIPTRVMFGTRP